MVFLTNINLNKNELQNAVIQPLAVAPSHPSLGQIYFDSTTNRLKQWNGTSWVVVGMIVEASSNNGKIKVDGSDITVYTLPTAASDTLGGVKVGSKLSIANDGTLSADAQAWNDITGKPSIDSAPTSGHNSNLVSSGGVYTAIQNAIVDSTNVFWCEYDTTTYAEITAAVDAYQLVVMNYSNRIYYLTANTLQTYFFVCSIVALGAKNTYVATCDSNNVWRSGSFHVVSEDDLSIALMDYLALSGGTMRGNLILNGAPTTDLQAATKKYVDDGLATKQGTLTFDSTPTPSSSNPVTSGGIYNAIPTQTSDLINNSGFITIDDVPEGAVASTTTPKMDGTATVGTEVAFARGDHRHPTDTSRAPLASPTFTGVPAAPTAAAGTNTTQLATTAFVQTAIGNLALITVTVVSSLPASGSSNVIYLVPKSISQTDNAYDEYIWVASTSSFEKIGDTEIDLSNYLQTTGNASSTTVTFTAAGSRALPTTGETLATIIGKVVKYFTDLKTVAFSGSYSDLSNKPTLPSINTATMSTSETTKSITASGTTVVNVQIVDSVTHEVIVADVTINGKAVTVTVAAVPTNALTITVLSI